HGYCLKGANTCANISKPGDKMPFMERNIDKAIVRITRNIKCHLSKSKSKTDYDILVSGGAPGIDELFKHLENNQNWVPSEWKNNHIE
ncbi:9589_t:CDS:2, partial [Rhizophagus irregularis]